MSQQSTDLDVTLLLLRPQPTRPHIRGEWLTRCIGMYSKDDDRLDDMVRYAKRKGWKRCSASTLIRLALDQIDIDELIRTHRRR